MVATIRHGSACLAHPATPDSGPMIGLVVRPMAQTSWWFAATIAISALERKTGAAPC